MLLEDHMIHVDDRRRLWWPEGARPRPLSLEEERSLQDGSGTSLASGQGPTDVFQSSGWKRGPPLEVQLEESAISRLLRERDDARRAKDFASADDLMEQLTSMGVGFLDDRANTLRVLATFSTHITRIHPSSKYHSTKNKVFS